MKNQIEKMEQLAISKGYKIVESSNPCFNFTHAVKDNVKIHIASISHNEKKISNYKEFKEELDNPEEFLYIK